MVNILLIQALPAPRLDSRDNLARALGYLDRCRGKGADLICFPEFFPFGGDEELAQAARDLEAYVAAGLMEDEGGKRYNTATLFDRQGNLVGRQRKHHPGDLERRSFGVSPGRGWEVWQTDFGRLGLPVCFDFWGHPEAARRLAGLEADLIVNLTVFPILRGHWPGAARVRAFDYYLPVAAVNTAAFTAEIAGRRYRMQGGRSFAIQPPVPADKQEMALLVREWDNLDNWVILSAGEEEAVLQVELDLDGPRHWRPLIQDRFGVRGREEALEL